jgi:hypothetical protein
MENRIVANRASTRAQYTKKRMGTKKQSSFMVEGGDQRE